MEHTASTAYPRLVRKILYLTRSPARVVLAKPRAGRHTEQASLALADGKTVRAT
jgi:hypothetical protein